MAILAATSLAAVALAAFEAAFFEATSLAILEATS